MTGPTQPDGPGGPFPHEDGPVDDAAFDAILSGHLTEETAPTGWAEVVRLIEVARGAPTGEELEDPAGVVGVLSARVGAVTTDLAGRRRRSRQLRAVLAGAAVVVIVGGAAAAATGVLPLPGISEDPPPSLPSPVVGDGPVRPPAGPGLGSSPSHHPARPAVPDQVSSEPSTAPGVDLPNGVGVAGDQVEPQPGGQPGNTPDSGGLPPAAGGNGNGVERGNSPNAGGVPRGGP